MNYLKIGLLCACVLVISGCTKATENTQTEPMQNNTNTPPPVADSMMPDTNTDKAMQVYTIDEVAQHNTREDCWTVIDGSVSDVTSFFGIHPGGDDNLEKACGVDATEMFQAVKKHDPKGYEKALELSIGTLN